MILPRPRRLQGKLPQGTENCQGSSSVPQGPSRRSGRGPSLPLLALSSNVRERVRWAGARALIGAREGKAHSLLGGTHAAPETLRVVPDGFFIELTKRLSSLTLALPSVLLLLYKTG